MNIAKNHLLVYKITFELRFTKKCYDRILKTVKHLVMQETGVMMVRKMITVRLFAAEQLWQEYVVSYVVKQCTESTISLSWAFHSNYPAFIEASRLIKHKDFCLGSYRL